MPHFITLEGGEGSGKSTAIRRLSAFFNQQNIAHVTTAEPGGTVFAESLGRMMLESHESSRPMNDPWMQALLFTAARRDHVRTVIQPALQAGQWVLSDRFFDSTRAYQGHAGGVDGRILHELHDVFVGGLRPVRTYILDIDPALALDRRKKRESLPETSEHKEPNQPGRPRRTDLFERQNLDFHQRIRQAFLAIAEEEPERCIPIDASQKKEDVFVAIRKDLSPYLETI